MPPAPAPPPGPLPRPAVPPPTPPPHPHPPALPAGPPTAPWPATSWSPSSLAVSVRAGSPAQSGEGLAELARRPRAFLAPPLLLTALLSIRIVGVKPPGRP